MPYYCYRVCVTRMAQLTVVDSGIQKMTALSCSVCWEAFELSFCNVFVKKLQFGESTSEKNTEPTEPRRRKKKRVTHRLQDAQHKRHPLQLRMYHLSVGNFELGPFDCLTQPVTGHSKSRRGLWGALWSFSHIKIGNVTARQHFSRCLSCMCVACHNFSNCPPTLNFEPAIRKPFSVQMNPMCSFFKVVWVFLSGVVPTRQLITPPVISVLHLNQYSVQIVFHPLFTCHL